MDYRYGCHTVYLIEYHFVWVTKYRYEVLTTEVAEMVRELVRQVFMTFEIMIVKGFVSKDHVHILIFIFEFKQIASNLSATLISLLGKR